MSRSYHPHQAGHTATGQYVAAVVVALPELQGDSAEGGTDQDASDEITPRAPPPTNEPDVAEPAVDWGEVVQLNCSQAVGGPIVRVVDELDVTGDGEPETFLVSECEALTSSWRQVMSVYEGATSADGPVRLQTLLDYGSGDHDSGLKRIEVVELTEDTLRVNGVTYASATEPLCCPSVTVEFTFAWTGSEYELVLRESDAPAQRAFELSAEGVGPVAIGTPDASEALSEVLGPPDGVPEEWCLWGFQTVTWGGLTAIFAGGPRLSDMGLPDDGKGELLGWIAKDGAPLPEQVTLPHNIELGAPLSSLPDAIDTDAPVWDELSGRQYVTDGSHWFVAQGAGLDAPIVSVEVNAGCE